jgi:hypothetical protein
MSIPRRRIIRPPSNGQATEPLHQRQLQKLRERLERERVGLTRWQARLRRAFNAVQKHQRKVARLERKITQLEG